MSDRPMYYNRAGQPVAEMTSEMFSEDARRVGRTIIGDYMVSTVHLVIDHSHGYGPPMIFETMVFKNGSTMVDEYTDRYSTEAEAVAGHESVVSMVRELESVGK